MEWPVILALLLAIPIILFPVAFIWYLNVGGLYAAIKEGRLKVFQPVLRKIRIVLMVTVPLAVYALLIWFFLGNFGWLVALAVALAIPVVLLVPALIWAAVVSGLYQVARDRLRRRAATQRRRAARATEEVAVVREVARGGL
jgi:hypothetical protein